MSMWNRLELSGLRDVQVRTLFQKISKFLEQVNAQLNLSTAAPGTVGGGGGTMITGPQTGFYGTSPTTGSDVPLLRASAILVFPEALGTKLDRSLTITLTDSVPYGALLTAANAFSANRISLLQPNGTNPLTVYPATVGRDGSDLALASPTFGLVIADGKPTRHFYRVRMSSDGIPLCENVGTSVPGTV